jgi:hypothetical protein
VNPSSQAGEAQGFDEFFFEESGIAIEEFFVTR